MSIFRGRHGCLAWFVCSIVIVGLIIIIVLESVGGPSGLSSLYKKLFRPAPGPLITSVASLRLASKNHILQAQTLIPIVVRASPTYLINPNSASLLATVDPKEDLLAADQQFYISSSSDNISGTFSMIARRLSDHHLVWQHPFQGQSADTPQISDGVLYFELRVYTGPSAMYALSESTGALLWRQVEPQSGFTYTLNNGFLYLFWRQGVEALTANNGTELWSHPEDVSAYHIFVDATTVYLVGERIQALSTVDGQQRWIFPAKLASEPTSPIYDPLGIYQGVLYVVNLDHQLFAFRTSDGKNLWMSFLPSYPQNPASLSSAGFGPYLVDGSLYLLIGENVYAFRPKDGSQAWHFKLQKTVPHQNSDQVSKVLGSLNGIIYIQLLANIVALQGSNGHKVWTIPLPPTIDTEATMDGQTIYYGSVLHTSDAPELSRYLWPHYDETDYNCSNAIKLLAIQSQNGLLQWQKQYKVPCTN